MPGSSRSSAAVAGSLPRAGSPRTAPPCAACARGDSSPARSTAPAPPAPLPRQEPQRRKSLEECLVALDHDGDARLLQHDLRDPDRIGVAAAPPGQVAPVGVVPAQQIAAYALRFRSCAFTEEHRVQIKAFCAPGAVQPQRGRPDGYPHSADLSHCPKAEQRPWQLKA